MNSLDIRKTKYSRSNNTGRTFLTAHRELLSKCHQHHLDRRYMNIMNRSTYISKHAFTRRQVSTHSQYYDYDTIALLTKCSHFFDCCAKTTSSVFLYFVGLDSWRALLTTCTVLDWWRRSTATRIRRPMRKPIFRENKILRKCCKNEKTYSNSSYTMQCNNVQLVLVYVYVRGTYKYEIWNSHLKIF